MSYIIREVKSDKRQYFPLIFLADEQTEMIERYLDKGTMYVLDDGSVKAECVVTDEGGGVLEIKNLAVLHQCQRQGFGRALIEFVAGKYKEYYDVLQVGTGESPLTVPFYEKCGFVFSHRIKNFFIDNYDHPIYEDGVLLKDMIYMRKNI